MQEPLPLSPPMQAVQQPPLHMWASCNPNSDAHAAHLLRTACLPTLSSKAGNCICAPSLGRNMGCWSLKSLPQPHPGQHHAQVVQPDIEHLDEGTKLMSANKLAMCPGAQVVQQSTVRSAQACYEACAGEKQCDFWVWCNQASGCDHNHAFDGRYPFQSCSLIHLHRVSPLLLSRSRGQAATGLCQLQLRLWWARFT